MTNPHAPTFRITADQIAAAEQAQAMIETLAHVNHLTHSASPFIPPASARQMILNEDQGWTWNFTTGQYEQENK